MLVVVAMVMAGCGPADRRAQSGTTAGAGAAGDQASAPFVAASTEQADRMAPGPPATLATRLASDENAALARLPAGAGHDLVVGNCLICHSAALIEQQHKDAAGWNKTVTQMRAWGAPLPAAQQSLVIGYLAEQFPARAAGPVARPAP
jgi:cytochrome c5